MEDDSLHELMIDESDYSAPRDHEGCFFVNNYVMSEFMFKVRKH